MEILWILLLMLVLIMIGVPVFASLGISSVVALLVRGTPLLLIPQRMCCSQSTERNSALKLMIL